MAGASTLGRSARLRGTSAARDGLSSGLNTGRSPAASRRSPLSGRVETSCRALTIRFASPHPCRNAWYHVHAAVHRLGHHTHGSTCSRHIRIGHVSGMRHNQRARSSRAVDAHQRADRRRWLGPHRRVGARSGPWSVLPGPRPKHAAAIPDQARSPAPRPAVVSGARFQAPFSSRWPRTSRPARRCCLVPSRMLQGACHAASISATPGRNPRSGRRCRPIGGDPRLTRERFRTPRLVLGRLSRAGRRCSPGARSSPRSKHDAGRPADRSRRTPERSASSRPARSRSDRPPSRSCWSAVGVWTRSRSPTRRTARWRRTAATRSSPATPSPATRTPPAGATTRTPRAPSTAWAPTRKGSCRAAASAGGTA